MKDSNNTINHLISSIYDGVEDPANFESALKEISMQLKIAKAHIFLKNNSNRQSGLSFCANIDGDFIREYHDLYYPTDYRMQFIKKSEFNKAIFDDEFNSEIELKTNPIHNILHVKYDINKIMGSNIGSKYKTGWFGVSTLRRGGEFSAETAREFEAIAIHVRKALHLRLLSEEVSEKAIAHESANDTQTHGIAVTIDDTTEYANSVAKEILKSGFLRMQDGKLLCSEIAGQRIIDGAYRQLQAGISPVIRLSDSTNGMGYAVQMFNPLPRFVKGRLERARRVTYKIMVFSEALEISTKTLERLGSLFNLSQSESGVISAVINLQSLGEYAKQKGVREDTVRKQLKSSMSKLGVNSQKQIIQIYERFRFFE